MGLELQYYRPALAEIYLERKQSEFYIYIMLCSNYF